jgi:hypothetical protein
MKHDEDIQLLVAAKIGPTLTPPYLVRAVRFGSRVVLAAKEAAKESREAAAIVAVCVVVSLIPRRRVGQTDWREETR